MSIPVQPGRLPTRRRGPVRRYLETRGVVGRHASPHVHTRLLADDGTRLAASYLPGPRDAPAAVLLLHGFAANRRKPAYARLADGLARHVAVLSLDLRGHGGSGGRSTLGIEEEADVRAGLHWLARYGHPRVIVVGASMGATAALYAASLEAPSIGVVTISATARFRSPAETEPMRRLEAVWHSSSRRRMLRLLLGVSLAAPEGWGEPPHPVEMATRITQPLLVVHGEDDPYFPVSDAASLIEAAKGPAMLWRRPAGFGHAEDGITAAFADALGQAVVEVAASGQFPPWHVQGAPRSGQGVQRSGQGVRRSDEDVRRPDQNVRRSGQGVPPSDQGMRRSDEDVRRPGHR